MALVSLVCCCCYLHLALEDSEPLLVSQSNWLTGDEEVRLMGRYMLWAFLAPLQWVSFARLYTTSSWKEFPPCANAAMVRHESKAMSACASWKRLLGQEMQQSLCILPNGLAPPSQKPTDLRRRKRIRKASAPRTYEWKALGTGRGRRTWRLLHPLRESGRPAQPSWPALTKAGSPIEDEEDKEVARAALGQQVDRHPRAAVPFRFNPIARVALRSRSYANMSSCRDQPSQVLQRLRNRIQDRRNAYPSRSTDHLALVPSRHLRSSCRRRASERI